MPLKWLNGEFIQKINRKAFRISAGLNGHAVMTGADKRMYVWEEAAQKWRIVGKSRVESVSIGRAARVYKVYKRKLFKQEPSKKTHDC